MNEKNFHGIDLNLLVVFVAVMRERSTTRAAERLFVSQPAVSHALRRLRSIFGDRLFVRARQGMVPTPRAEVLYRGLLPSLEAIERKLQERDHFEPGPSERMFRLGLPSALDICVMPLLLETLAKRAPGVSLVVRPVSLHTGSALLDSEEIELGVSVFPKIESWHRRRNLGLRNYGCVFNGRRLGIRPPITLKRYLALPHLLTSFSGERSGVVDTALAKRDLTRRVLVAGDFAALPFYLSKCDAIATLPDYAAQVVAERLALNYSKPPLALPDFPLSMIWHDRHDYDPGHRWFRDLVGEIVTAI
jgi:LysR family transcriptional activator of mexEF-oprN operon